jgi:DNA-binding transcriptional LysR family regulator
VAVYGPLIVDDEELLLRAALDSVGLAFMSERQAMSSLRRGALVRVLLVQTRRIVDRFDPD